MRRVIETRRDRGAAALVIVSLFASAVLVGVAALTVDVGQWMVERRVLQNGADSAALSLARTCSTTPVLCSWSGASTILSTLNDANAGLDGVSGFNTAYYPNGVCQNNLVSTSLMPNCVAGHSTDCLPPPTWVTPSTKYVEVHTKTATSTGTKVPPIFGGALGQNDGGKTIYACSRVALMPVDGGAVLPLTISLCEWQNYVTSPDKIVPGPPYTNPPYPGLGWPSNASTFGAFPSYEHKIYLHDTSGAAHCTVGPSGYDLPGGFGWLGPTNGCQVTLTEGDWVLTSPGTSPPAVCSFTALVGRVVLVPIYDLTNGLPGNNLEYRIAFFAAFYVTGYRVPSDPYPSIATGTLAPPTLCNASQTCIMGWFAADLVPAGDVDYSGGGSPGSALTTAIAG
jgi:hypothetical protein